MSRLTHLKQSKLEKIDFDKALKFAIKLKEIENIISDLYEKPKKY